MWKCDEFCRNDTVLCFWTLSSLYYSVSQGVALQTISQVAARCGENVTLTCEATLSQQLDIKLFAWVAKNKTCHYEDHQPDPEVLCESTAKTPQHRLTLTLLNVMPVNQGEYLCKLRSKLGVKSATTVVTVQGEYFFIHFFIVVFFYLSKSPWSLQTALNLRTPP